MTETTNAQTDNAPALHPWENPWWRAPLGEYPVLLWIILIHATAAIGLVMYPLPGWRIVLGALALAWIGGIGTTVCYHRALAHRSVRLNPWVQNILIFFAMFNGSGGPLTWSARHRLHHAKADTPEDISSPAWGGFWWAHLRWLWQTQPPSLDRYCPDLNSFSMQVWRVVQTPLLIASYLCGLAISPAAFFWLGAIRLCFALHAQCFVNSIAHTEPGAAPGEDSSRNIAWLGVMHFFQGENWHRNHHARAGSARLGWDWTEPDVGYLVIRGLERLGLATDVRCPSRAELERSRRTLKRPRLAIPDEPVPTNRLDSAA